MDVEALRDYCLSKKGVVETLPFDNNTLVFKVAGKMFALISLERIPQSVNLKCEPEKALELRATYPDAILPGWHMNKKHWNTCVLQLLDPALLRSLIDHSYEQVILGMTKKLQAQLAAM